MDENFAYWSASFQLAGKWFSSSLALGTNVVATITDRSSSDMSHYHDRARCQLPSYFLPHGGPITHSSTGSKPDSPVYPLLRSIICSWLCVLSRATVREMISSRCSEPPFSHSVQVSIVCTFAWNFLLYLHICSRCFLKFQLERYFCHIPWIVHQIINPIRVSSPEVALYFTT